MAMLDPRTQLSLNGKTGHKDPKAGPVINELKNHSSINSANLHWMLYRRNLLLLRRRYNRVSRGGQVDMRPYSAKPSRLVLIVPTECMGDERDRAVDGVVVERMIVRHCVTISYVCLR